MLNITHVAVLAEINLQGSEELYDGSSSVSDPELSLDDTLEKGIQRLLEKSTWKLWQWSPGEPEFSDADSFR